jgi:hypothetical protein
MRDIVLRNDHIGPEAWIGDLPKRDGITWDGYRAGVGLARIVNAGSDVLDMKLGRH